MGYYNSLALDRNNYPHIAYYDKDRGYLKYLYYDGQKWQGPQVLDSSGGAGQYVVLKLDSNNRRHIAYFDDASLSLKYLYFNGSSWQGPQTVVSNLSAVFKIDLVLDSQNRPHIGYMAYENYMTYLRYIYFDGTSWQGPQVLYPPPDSSNYIISETLSMGIDSNNRPHFIFWYYISNVSYLVRLYYDSSTWQGPETIDSVNESHKGGITSFKFDSQNHIYLAYYDVSKGNLNYTFYNGQNWATPSVLDYVGNVGNNPILVLDSQNRPIIVYGDSTNFKTKYIYFNGVSWSTPKNILDQNFSNYYSYSFVLDLSDNPRLSYYSLFNPLGLKYLVYDKIVPVAFTSHNKKIYKNAIKVRLFAKDTPSELEDYATIYYTLDGSKPTIHSWKYKSPIVITKNTTIKFFAKDVGRNLSSIKTKKYIIKKVKFVTKSAKNNEILIKKWSKKNKRSERYETNSFNFYFTKLFSQLQKKRYYIEVEQIKKFPFSFVDSQEKTMKKYWKVQTNLNNYPLESKKFKVNLIFSYSGKELNNLKKRNANIKAADLKLMYYHPLEERWIVLPAAHRSNWKSFYISFDKFLFPRIYFTIGIK